MAPSGPKEPGVIDLISVWFSSLIMILNGYICNLISTYKMWVVLDHLPGCCNSIVKGVLGLFKLVIKKSLWYSDLGHFRPPVRFVFITHFVTCALLCKPVCCTCFLNELDRWLLSVFHCCRTFLSSNWFGISVVTNHSISKVKSVKKMVGFSS